VDAAAVTKNATHAFTDAVDGNEYTAVVINVGNSGVRINKVLFAANGTTVAGAVGLILKDGSNYYLLKTIPVPVFTASASAGSWNYELEFASGLFLEYGQELGAISTASDMAVTAFYGEY